MSVLLTPESEECVESIPPLQNGDRLTREEFERRYHAMPDVKKAELIQGVVYIPSPVSHTNHSNPQYNFIVWSGPFVASTPGLAGGDNGSLKLKLDSEPQPDVYLIVTPEFGGQVQFDEDGYIVGAPEWTGEVSASSVSYDLHDKFEAYRENGVKEYVVWRVLDNAIDWFLLVGERYERLPISPEGWYKSRVFPGLWLDPQALIDGDLAKVLQVAQQGVVSPEHQQFVEEMKRRKQPTP